MQATSFSKIFFNLDDTVFLLTSAYISRTLHPLVVYNLLLLLCLLLALLLQVLPLALLLSFARASLLPARALLFLHHNPTRYRRSVVDNSRYVG